MFCFCEYIFSTGENILTEANIEWQKNTFYTKGLTFDYFFLSNDAADLNKDLNFQEVIGRKYLEFYYF